MEFFDNAEDYENHSPQQWVAICRGSAEPMASVLQYSGDELVMKPCWVLDYSEQEQRYLIELLDGSRKNVKRLRLRFNQEDPQKFSERLEICQKRRTAFASRRWFDDWLISMDAPEANLTIEAKNSLVSKMVRSINQQEEAEEYVQAMRREFQEVQQSYRLASKLSCAKREILEKYASGEACNNDPNVREFARLAVQAGIGPHVPGWNPSQPAKISGLITGNWTLSVPATRQEMQKNPIFSAKCHFLMRSLFTRFEAIENVRLIDPTRFLPSSHQANLNSMSDDHYTKDWECAFSSENIEIPIDNGLNVSNNSDAFSSCELGTGVRYGANNKVFLPQDFFQEMRAHQKELSLLLEKVWRDGVVSEILDKLSDNYNFFVDNTQKYEKSDLRKILKKCDMVVGSQMRSFFDASISSWVDLINLFHRNPSGNCVPPPFLSLKIIIESTGIENDDNGGSSSKQQQQHSVQLHPNPEQLISEIHELMDGALQISSRLWAVEKELIPFCDALESGNMFSMAPSYPLLVESKADIKDTLTALLEGPQKVLNQFREYADLLLDEESSMILRSSSSSNQQYYYAADKPYYGLTEEQVLDVDSMTERVQHLSRIADQIENLSSRVVLFPLFELQTASTMDKLSHIARKKAERYLKAVAQSVTDRSFEVLNSWTQLHVKVLTTPADEEEVASLKAMMNSIGDVTDPLVATTGHIHHQLALLDSSNHQISDEVVESVFRAHAWPAQIRQDISEASRNLEVQKNFFMQKLEQDKSDFYQDMKRFEDQFDFIKQLGEFDSALQFATRINGLKDNLDKAKERVASFADREKLFSIEVFSFFFKVLFFIFVY